MSCHQCTAARANPHSGLYSANCDGCKARAIANSMAFHEAIRVGKFTPQYRYVLEQVFGADGCARGHKMVKSWDDSKKEQA